MAEHHRPDPNVGIYALADPRTGDVRYIGSSERLIQRYKDHLTRKPAKMLGRWLWELKVLNLKPTFLILELCPKWKLTERETFHMDKHHGKLLNVAQANRTYRNPNPPPPRMTVEGLLRDYGVIT